MSWSTTSTWELDVCTEVSSTVSWSTSPKRGIRCHTLPLSPVSPLSIGMVDSILRYRCLVRSLPCRVHDDRGHILRLRKHRHVARVQFRRRCLHAFCEKAFFIGRDCLVFLADDVPRRLRLPRNVGHPGAEGRSDYRPLRRGEDSRFGRWQIPGKMLHHRFGRQAYEALLVDDRGSERRW